MTEREFIEKTLKVGESRTHKVTGSLGVYDAYKWLRKNKWLNIGRPVTEHEFYTIIRTVNNYMAEELIKGNDVILPIKMGKLEIRKNKASVYYNEAGELKVNLPIDWNATLKLWYEDEQALRDKTLIKIDEKEIFKVFYNRSFADYNNKSFYQFNINRDIKLGLKHNIKAGMVDAFLQ